MAIHHVLATTDFGPSSAHALRMAADLAASSGGRLTVVHVVPPPPYPYPVPASEGAFESAREHLEDDVAALGGDVVSIVREGAPVEKILETAREIGADLVVVGTRSRRGAKRAFLGSVAEKLTRLSPVPVLTVHPWRFENRVAAGRQLADAVQLVQLHSPAVIAMSRDAVVVAAEVAGSFGDTPHLLLAKPILRDGAVVGAVCEEGTERIDPRELERAAVDLERDRAIHHARALLGDESIELRGSSSIGDVWKRPAVVVVELLDEPWSALAACDALRGLGASRVIIAATAATSEAHAALAGAGEEVIVLHTTDDATSAPSLYRHDAPVSIREAADYLEPNVVSVVDA